MNDFTILNRLSLHQVNSISGRYLNEEMLSKSLSKLVPKAYRKIGHYSVEKRPIHQIDIGTGPFKILIWSQMHGNESTTSKALLDVLSLLFNDTSDEVSVLLKKFSFCIIPMLNPDGAEIYQRKNANDIDLNRDAQSCTQPESQYLRNIFENFQPDLCLNMHDQRTIFSAGHQEHPATVSFLAPSFDRERSVNLARKKAMYLITEAYHRLSKDIPGQIGRYDDKFNLNCVGDYFMSQGVPTILFEAGHYPKDYYRNQTRTYIFIALMEVFEKIEKLPNIKNFNNKSYFKIPENEKFYYDIVFRRVKEKGISRDMALQFTEYLSVKKIEFLSQIVDNQNTNQFFGHREINANNQEIELKKAKTKDGQEYIKEVLINNKKYRLSLTNH